MSRQFIEATISLVRSSEGGRSGPLRSGYRSLLRFEGHPVDFGFELELSPHVRMGGLRPGESGVARLSLWAVEDLPPIVAGMKFEIREGARVVGYGSVLHV